MCHPGSDANPLGGVADVREQRLTIESQGAELPVFEAAPSGTPRGSVVIIHDIWGANEFYHDLARRLAAEGFRALLPDLFVRSSPLAEQTSAAARGRGAALPSRQALADLQRVVDVALEPGGRVASLGFCMGGTLVMLLAAREPRVSAGVIYYGFPANPHPTATRPFAPLDEAAEVGRPLLGFWGDRDQGVGMENVAAYDAALSAADKPHEFIIYPGLPHAFLTFDPSKPFVEESEASWQRTLAFLGEHLR